MSEQKVFPKEPVKFKWSAAKYSADKTVTMHRLLAEKLEKQGKGEIVKAKASQGEAVATEKKARK